MEQTLSTRVFIMDKNKFTLSFLVLIVFILLLIFLIFSQNTVLNISNRSTSTSASSENNKYYERYVKFRSKIHYITRENAVINSNNILGIIFHNSSYQFKEINYREKKFFSWYTQYELIYIINSSTKLIIEIDGLTGRLHSYTILGRSICGSKPAVNSTYWKNTALNLLRKYGYNLGNNIDLVLIKYNYDENGCLWIKFAFKINGYIVDHFAGVIILYNPCTNTTEGVSIASHILYMYENGLFYNVKEIPQVENLLSKTINKLEDLYGQINDYSLVNYTIVWYFLDVDNDNEWDIPVLTYKLIIDYVGEKGEGRAIVYIDLKSGEVIDIYQI